VLNDGDLCIQVFDGLPAYCLRPSCRKWLSTVAVSLMCKEILFTTITSTIPKKQVCGSPSPSPAQLTRIPTDYEFGLHDIVIKVLALGYPIEEKGRY
jgi:hypothetical protein